jgi:organic hydroperoxide reductase OsmC/OhrA
MGSTTIEYRLLPGTAAAIARSGTHSVIADRPPGKAGGMGLGFNGGELLAFALGGCLCNDLQAIAQEMGRTISELRVTVTIGFAGEPTRATNAAIAIHCDLADGSDPTALIEAAKARTTIANSIRAGVLVSITTEQ